MIRREFKVLEPDLATKARNQQKVLLVRVFVFSWQIAALWAPMMRPAVQRPRLGYNSRRSVT
jgi:hypothetical protein